MTQTSSRDLELLSAYLDEQLSQPDVARLEARIKADPELRAAYDDLRQTRALLRKLPARRAPRNFRLTPQMVGSQPRLPRSFPVFRFASVLASVLLLLGYAINLAAPVASMAAATSLPYDTYMAPAVAETEAPMPEMATAPAAMEATATTEAPQNFAPKLAATDTPELSLTQQDAVVTPENRSMGAASTEALNVAPPTPAWPVHPGWLFGLLGLAVVSGAGAWIVRARAEQKWGRKPTTKDIVLMVLAFVVVLVLAAGIYWMFAQ